MIDVGKYGYYEEEACDVSEVRQLESDYKDIKKQIKEFKNMHKEDLNRVYILNILNGKLEKKLEIAVKIIVDLLEDCINYRTEECEKVLNKPSDSMIIYRDHINKLQKLKGDQNEM